MILYCFLGIPQSFGSMNISESYKTMLTNLCVTPDDNMLENSIGAIRNYIVKLGPALRDLTDETNTSYMNYIFRTV